MAVTIIVNTKSVGKLRAAVAKTEFELENAPCDTRSLIRETVRACVRQYERRAKDGILQVLTDGQIADRAGQGKISFGSLYGDTDVDIEAAQENALQCFEDGVYRIFIGSKQLESLDDTVDISGRGEVTFVRLTMLSGRTW